MRAQVHSQGLLGEAASRERWHGSAIEHFEAMPAAGDEHHNTALEKIRAKIGRAQPPRHTVRRRRLLQTESQALGCGPLGRMPALLRQQASSEHPPASSGEFPAQQLCKARFEGCHCGEPRAERAACGLSQVQVYLQIASVEVHST